METIMAKKRNTFNVVCLIRKNRVMKNGQVPLFMRITVNSNVVDIPIAGSVNPSQWSQAQGKTRGNSREAQELNYNIQSVKSRIHQIFCDLGLAGKPITAQIIKDIYLGNHKDEEEDGKTLVEVHSEHNERCRQLLNIEYSQSTIYKFDTSLKYLKEFIMIMKKITESDARVSYFFNTIDRITLLLEDLRANQKPLLNGQRFITDEDRFSISCINAAAQRISLSCSSKF